MASRTHPRRRRVSLSGLAARRQQGETTALGLEGLLTGRADLLASAPPDEAAFATFIQAWYDKHHVAEVTTSEVADLALAADVSAEGGQGRLGLAVAGRRNSGQSRPGVFR